jgi:glycosyltransferase involved in cell wall biosynthesis
MRIDYNNINKGVIIRNGLEENGSWTKRVIHWQLSFTHNLITAKIVTSYPSKPESFLNGTDSIYYLSKRKWPRIIHYLISPIIILSFLIRDKPNFVLLVHGGFFEFFVIPIYCNIAKIPLFIEIVDTIGKIYKKKKTVFDYVILYNKKLFDRFVLKYSSEIFVISSELERKYKKMYPNKKVTKSKPSTVNVEQFIEFSNYEISFLHDSHYNIFNNKGAIKIFYAGTIARLNGIEFFFRAISEIIRETKIDIKIIFAVIIGDVKELLNLAAMYQLNSITEIIPPVSQNYLPILLKRADILFIPEQGFETANAGFPGKTSEYLMSGNPVITTYFSDLENYLIDGNNSCISKIGDLESYRDNLFRLVTDLSFRNSIGQAGRELAINKFSHYDCAVPYIMALRSFYNISN